MQVLGGFLGIDVGEGEEAKSQIHLHLSLYPHEKGEGSTQYNHLVFLWY